MMLAALTALALSYNEEDFDGLIRDGETDIAVNDSGKRYLVLSGYFVAFMPKSTDKLEGYALNEKTQATLFEKNYAILFNKDGYFVVKSNITKSLKVIAYQQFAYPGCDSTAFIIGNGEYSIGCDKSDIIPLKTDSSVCLYVAFPPKTSTSKIENISSLSYNIYDINGYDIKTTTITQPYMVKITNNHDKCDKNSLIVNTTISSDTEVESLELTVNGSMSFATIGGSQEDEPVKTVIIVVSVVAVLAVIVIVAVSIVLVKKCRRQNDVSSKSPEQLEAGIVDDSKDTGYNPMNATSPLADAQNHIPTP